MHGEQAQARWQRLTRLVCRGRAPAAGRAFERAAEHTCGVDWPSSSCATSLEPSIACSLLFTKRVASGLLESLALSLATLEANGTVLEKTGEGIQAACRLRHVVGVASRSVRSDGEDAGRIRYQHVWHVAPEAAWQRGTA